MPAAVAVPAIIGGATAIGGAAMQSHAAGVASKRQQESADKALALNRDIYNQQREMMQPYVTGGQTAFARLMDGYWNNRPYGMTAPQGQGAVAGVPQANNPNQIGGGAFGQAMGGPNQAVPRMAGAGMPPDAATVRQAIPRTFGGGGMVPMRAPDGSMAMVPAQHVDRLLQAGGQRIG